MKAVILAAGMGKRLRDQHVLPKGFIRLGTHTIIEESIAKLKQCGIKNILLVTGFGSNYYEELALKLNVSLVKNHRFEQSGSLYSLYCARDWLDEDFILLESDLVYDKNALLSLIEDPHENAILVSGFTQSGDEVYVEAHDLHLIAMSKNRNVLDPQHIMGEFVGINKLRLGTYQQLLKRVENDHDLLDKSEYEVAGLVTLSKQVPIFCHKINDLIWCEIDDKSHLERAKGIYEKLK